MGKAAKKTPDKSPEQEIGTLVPQEHGGALWQGRGPNPFRGSPGRPKNEIRKALQRLAEDALPVLGDIMDGQVIKRARIPLSAVLKHARCMEECCAGRDVPLRPMRPDQVMMVEIEGMESASPGDRLKAFESAARYGIGTERGYDEQLVGKLAQATREFVLDTQVEDLHKAWVRIIGDHVRGVDSSQGGGE